MKDSAERVSQRRLGVSLVDGAVHFLRAFRCSANGFRVCFRDEIAFRQECALAIPHFILVVLLPLSVQARVYLTALWFLLIVVELLNTAIESVTDLATPGQHDLAAKAKDCGSAAVSCVLALFLVSWLVMGIRLVRCG